MSTFPMRAVITRMVGLHPVRMEIERRTDTTRVIDGKVFFDKTMKYWSTFGVDIHQTSTMNTYEASSFAGKGYDGPRDIEAVPRHLKVFYGEMNESAHRLSSMLSRQLLALAEEAFNNGNDGGPGFQGLVRNALSMGEDLEVAEILNLCPDEFINPDTPQDILVDILNAPMFEGLENPMHGRSLAFRLGLYKLLGHIHGFEPRPLSSEDDLNNELEHFVKISLY